MGQELRLQKGTYLRQGIYFLGELHSEDISWFIKAGHKVEMPAGGTLIKKGENIKALFLLVEGELSVHINQKHSENLRKIAHLKAGDIVGELSFLDSSPPNATVKAATDAVLLAIPRHILEEKLDTDIGFSARFYRGVGVLLASRLRKTVKQLGHPLEQQSSDQLLEKQLEQTHDLGIAQDWFAYLHEKLLAKE